MLKQFLITTLLSLLTITSLQSADFNNDNIPDLLFKTDEGKLKTWELDSSYAKVQERWLTNLGSDDWELYEDIVDVNNDGNIDIILQSKSLGYIKVMQMNGFSLKEMKWTGSPGTDYKIIGVSDIDGDNYKDIILQQESTGYLKAYKLDANSKGTATWIGNPGKEYEAIKVTDVDGDGTADIVLHHTTLGYLKAFKLNSSFSATAKWIGSPGTSWEVEDVADIDGDGICDIVLQDETLGYIKAFKLNSSFSATANWVGSPGSDYEIEKVVDIDGDGTSDILLREKTLGYVKAFQLNNSTMKGTAKWIGNPGSSDWEIKLANSKSIIFQDKTKFYLKSFSLDTSFNGIFKWLGSPGTWDMIINTDEEIVESINITTDHADSFTTADTISQDSTTSAEITYNDYDYFKVVIASSGTLNISTLGSTDTVGYLYNINSTQLTSDDQSGVSNNFAFTYTVTAGTYYIKVKGYSGATGDYSLVASFTEMSSTSSTDIYSNVAKVPHNKSSIPLLLVLMSYNDVKISSSDSTWSSKVFGTYEGQLNHYFDEVSNSKFQFSRANESAGTYNDGVVSMTLNKNHPNLDIDSYSYNSIVHADFKSALEGMNSVVDFSNYDNDANGYITTEELQIMFVMAGYEDSAEGGHVNYGTWGHAYCVSSTYSPTLDGVSLMSCNDGGYSVFGEKHDKSSPSDASIGIIAHELGHAAFDLPDLYNTSGSSGGIGNFGLMGGGSWGQKSASEKSGSTPTHLSAWSKSYLGWVTPTEGSGSESLYEASSSNYNVIQISIDEDEYYLLENRNNSGYDRGLYSLDGNVDGYYDDTFDGGIAIWHIDKTKLTTTYFFNNNVNAITSSKGVDLVEASTATIDTYGSTGSDKALFFSPNATSFGTKVTNISGRGSVMTINVE